ncbi:mannitol dehydrogenase family protein [Pseudomonas sp. Marseille-QA0892]
MTETQIRAAARGEQISIVHLGLGAFHRAHQAVYLERYRQRSGDLGWGVASANLRSNKRLVDALRVADHRYHVAEFADSENVTVREIGVIEQTLFTGRDEGSNNGRDLEALLSRLADEATRIVTLTVTEKGYFLSPSEGILLRDHPQIAADIAQPQMPSTAPGILVEALARRRAAGRPPFTVLCCDNMPDNGKRTRAAVTQLAACRDEGLAEWIEHEVAFPSSMVDRIVPAMTDTEFERLSRLGINDTNAVVCEAFSQWVVEDHFPTGRPDWEEEGVEMVADVAPFETMKLRMLNGSHSLLAYLGAQAGIETVYDAVTQPPIAAFLRRYMLTEAAPTLDMPAGTDLAAYSEQLLARFANDSLRHKLHQIAMDGSQKLPQRWLQGALSRLEAGEDAPCTALGIAAWIHYSTGRSPDGTPHGVDDPLATTLAKLHGQHTNTESLVHAFMSLDSVFPPALSRHASFVQTVCAYYQKLREEGVMSAVKELVA